MPQLSYDEVQALLEEIKKNFMPAVLNISERTERKAIKECDEYIEFGNKNINDMSPLSVYFVISKLSEDRQIKFIKENIKYIKDHDEDIFLYNMLSPKSLSYFLSYNVLKELKDIDRDILKKLISQNFENLCHGFSHEDYCNLYKDFYNELLEIKNNHFISILDFHNKFCYYNINTEDINSIFKLQRIYNEEIMNFILEKYKSKIPTFTPQELLKFLSYIDDVEIYNTFVNKYYKKLNNAFNSISEYGLKEYLAETDVVKQRILISNFFDNIITNKDIRKIIYGIKSDIIINIYKTNKEVLKSLTLNDWIKVLAKRRTFNDSFKEILDSFEINDIESLFDTKFYMPFYNRKDITSLRYIETKYRKNIITTGKLEEIKKTTSIFSDKYLKNLSEFKEMFKNNTISKSDKKYKQHLSNFILFLKNRNIINNIENNNFKEIEKLFYRIIMGKSITILYELNSIEEITIFNRLGQIDFKVEDFTVEQLENYNVKLHRKLCKKFEKSDLHFRSYKQLILKLMLMVGFNNARALLEIEDTLPVLEHIVGNVDVKNVKLDEQCNPILNTKLMNLLFSDKDYSKLKKMLSNKDNDLYKHFPRIFSEWEMIVMNGKDKTLKIILDFLKSDEISLPPKYYRLEGLFRFIGCNNSIVNETLSLHNQMLTRVNSTIPRIVGIKDEYSYEILRLNDMEALVIGNKTDCCFTVLGNGYSCLKHALTSKNGRILVIKKGDEVLAHSWVWRNGDLLCFDNIEISKKINFVDFFDIYLKIADELIKTSFDNEGIESCIKNITIGFTNFDKEIKGIEQYPCLIAKTCDIKYKDFETKLGNNRKFVDVLPQPIEEVGYSDSKNVQYLIRGNGMFNLGQSYFNYQDDRKAVMYYSKDNSYDEDYLSEMNKKINSLRYIKEEEKSNINNFKLININDFDEVYCNDDWFIIYKDNCSEKYIKSNDPRAELELSSINCKSYTKIKSIS